MRDIAIPSFLREALGETQTPAALLAIGVFGLSVPALLLVCEPTLFQALPWWRSGPALLLILDIAAGCVANFTRSTNNFYAARPRSRWTFIGVHVHIVAIALLLATGLPEAVAVWLYTITGAAVVNLVGRSKQQPLAGGLLLAVGLGVSGLIASSSPAMLFVMQLFLLKVIFAFAVDHYRDPLPADVEAGE